MTDVHSQATRSFNMSRIKGKNTSPELLVRSYLFSNGFRYRLHVKGMPGKPDLVLAKYQTVIFVNGCFWHGHINCRYAHLPKSRTEWWQSKIEKTKIVDARAVEHLIAAGWNILIIWECALKKGYKESSLATLATAVQAMRQGDKPKYIEIGQPIA